MKLYFSNETDSIYWLDHEVLVYAPMQKLEFAVDTETDGTAVDESDMELAFTAIPDPYRSADTATKQRTLGDVWAEARKDLA